MARDLTLDAKVTGIVPVVAGLDKMAGSIDEVGDQAKQSERRLEALGRAIEFTAAKAAFLNDRFLETGDTTLFKELTKDQRMLAGLKRMQKGLQDTESDAQRLFRTLSKGGKEGGLESLFGGGFSPSRLLLSTPPPALAAAALPAAAFGGGLVSAAGLLTAGLGATAGGVLISASQRKDVQDAYVSMAKGIFADLSTDASGFAGPLIESAKIFGAAFRDERAGIRGALQDAAQFVEPLAHGIAGLVHNFLPGFEHAVRAAEPVVKVLSEDVLPAIGEGLGNFFDDIADAAPGAVDALKDFGSVTKDALNTTGDLVGGLSDLYHGLHQIDVLGGLRPEGGQIKDAILSIVPFAEEIRDAYRLVDYQLGLSNDRVLKTAENFDKFGNIVFDVGGAAERLEGELVDVNKAFDDLFNVQVSGTEAAIDWEKALDDLRESVKDNGKTLDITTEKGRENADQLLAAAKAAETMRQANIAQGVSAEEANRRYQDQINFLIQLGTQLGLSRAAVLNLIGGLNSIPKNIDTNVNVRMQMAGFSADDVREAARARLPGLTVIPTNTRNRPQMFDRGGLVQGHPGSPQLAVVHAGEYVVPREQVAAAGRARTLQPVQLVVSGRVLAEVLIEHALDTGRTPAALFPDRR